MDFSCVEGCSKCCIEREYYPSIKFGKIGVLVLPEEKHRLEDLSKKHSVKAIILPRIGASENNSGPEKILAFQMMGREPNGNTCPFLDTEGDAKSPHGGYRCKIYEERPLACRAYPVVEDLPPALDPKCKFCETCSSPNGNIDSEIESLLKIKSKMVANEKYLWRYATGIGELTDMHQIESGWFLI